MQAAHSRLIEHRPGPGGFQAIIALIGATMAVGMLALGKALKKLKKYAKFAI